MKMSEVKRTVKEAFTEEYGFAPTAKEIDIHDVHIVNGEAQFVAFEVNGHTYTWDGFTFEHSAPWEATVRVSRCSW